MHKQREMLQRMLKDDEIYIVPGVFECIGALLAENAGFQSVSITGHGLTATHLGMPDLALMSLSEVVERSRHIANAVGIPVLCDGETGYGGTLNVYRTVSEFEQAGLAGIHLEDQASPKKCAYYKGDQRVISPDEYVIKLKAALAARKDSSFAIIARTDAFRINGLNDTIDRCKRYADAGADSIYVIGITSLDEIRAISQAVPVPLKININDGDALASVPHKVLKAAGVKMISYPSTVRGSMIKGVETVLKALAEKGNTNDVLDKIASFTALPQLTRVSYYQELERTLEGKGGQ